MLEEGLRLLRSSSPGAYRMGSEVLAEAFKEQGYLNEAAQVLEEASHQKSFLPSPYLAGSSWLRIRSQLAQLYREMGRDEDARKIEDELRRLLALADSDHPILRQLDRTEDLALREPAN